MRVKRESSGLFGRIMRLTAASTRLRPAPMWFYPPIRLLSRIGGGSGQNCGSGGAPVAFARAGFNKRLGRSQRGREGRLSLLLRRTLNLRPCPCRHQCCADARMGAGHFGQQSDRAQVIQPSAGRAHHFAYSPMDDLILLLAGKVWQRR